MIVTANIFIDKIEDGEIIGRDITDNKQYTCRFFTDEDISVTKRRSKNFKSEKVTQEQLLKMIQNANDFPEREEKVKGRIAEALSANETAKEIDKTISRLEDDKEDIFEDDDVVKIKDKKNLLTFLDDSEKTVNKENFDSVLEKLKRKKEKTFNAISEEVNKKYNIWVNSAVSFTGNLDDDGKTIVSKNAYLDKDKNITERKGFYRFGVSGDFFKDHDLNIAIKVVKNKKKTRWLYIAVSEFLTSKKVYNIIKRNYNTLENNDRELFILFLKKNETVNDVEEVKEYNSLVDAYFKDIKDTSKEERAKIWKSYFSKFKEALKKLKENVEKDEKVGEKIAQTYNISLPILNHYELEKNIDNEIERQMKIFKNIHGGFLHKLAEARANQSNSNYDEVYKNILKYIEDELSKELRSNGVFGLYYYIAGRTDTKNDGYGFITEIENARKKVKNFDGFFVNIAQLKKIKNKIFNYLKGVQKALDKKNQK